MFPLRDSTHLNPPSQGREKKTAQQIARFRNKCAMPDYSHAELVSVSCGLNPSPTFQAPSPQVARGKIRSVGNMKENIFSNMVNSLFIYSYRYGLFTFHVSLFTSHLKHPLLIQTLHSLILNTKKTSLFPSSFLSFLMLF